MSTSKRLLRTVCKERGDREMRKLRVAMLGFEHVHAVSMYDVFSRYPDRYELLGCAEFPPREGEIPEDPAERKKRVLGQRPLALVRDWR